MRLPAYSAHLAAALHALYNNHSTVSQHRALRPKRSMTAGHSAWTLVVALILLHSGRMHIGTAAVLNMPVRVNISCTSCIAHTTWWWRLMSNWAILQAAFTPPSPLNTARRHCQPQLFSRV